MFLNEIYNIFHKNRFQFSRYFAIGLSALFLDLGTLFLFKEYLGLTPVLAVVFNQILMIGYVFLMNKYITFKSKEFPHKQLIRFIVLYVGNYIFAVLWMGFWSHFYAFDYLTVRVFNIILSVSWNFLLYKYWVYRL